MTSITLRDIPDDIAQFILQVQWDIKKKKVAGSVSQSHTVIHIIKEFKKISADAKQGESQKIA